MEWDKACSLWELSDCPCDVFLVYWPVLTSSKPGTEVFGFVDGEGADHHARREPVQSVRSWRERFKSAPTVHILRCFIGSGLL